MIPPFLNLCSVPSLLVVSDSLWPHGLQPARLLCPWDFPGKNAGVGCYFLLQGIFPTQGSNPGLPHCRQILYCLSHQGSPKILEWVVYPFSRGSSWSRNWTAVSCLLYQLSYQGRSIPKSSGIFKSSFILIYQKHLPSLSLPHWLLLINFLWCILFIFPTLFPLSFPYSQITFLLLNPLPRCFYPFAWVK